MRKISFLLLLAILSSCEQKNDSYSMYGLLNEEFAHSNGMLKAQIAENLKHEKLINDKLTKSYDSLTTRHLRYLSETYMELLNNVGIDQIYDYEGELSKIKYINEYFFDGENYNKNGIQFISKLEKYRAEILILIKDKNLKKRVSSVLNTDFITTRDAEKVNYLNYMYKDFPLISVLTHMKNREKSIIEFENEFIKNRLLNK